MEGPGCHRIKAQVELVLPEAVCAYVGKYACVHDVCVSMHTCSVCLT